MKRIELSIKERILSAIIYILGILFLCRFFSQSWVFLTNADSTYNILFVSGALLLIFGAYISEPFFTKPVDVITNSIAILLALLSINNKDSFSGYWILFYTNIVLCLLSIVLLLISRITKESKLQLILFYFTTKIGQSKVIFSIMYILTIYSYFTEKPIEFFAFLTFWLFVVTQFVIENGIVFIAKIFSILKNNDYYGKVIGEAIGCENPYLYSIEVDYKRHGQVNVKKGDLVYIELEKNSGTIGIIINSKQLLNKNWLSVYLLSVDNNYLHINLKSKELFSSSNSIYSKNNQVYFLDINTITDDDQKRILEDNYFYKNRDNFIGYVTRGSDISKIRFLSLVDETTDSFTSIKEGTIVKTEIFKSEVLYQIIDAITDKEELKENNTYGYLIGVARKLGTYDLENKELKIVKWLPGIYTPIFIENYKEGEKNNLSIGYLPETNLEIIIKDMNSLITHNTAILGILGIGKSCLTFELLQKIILHLPNIKIVCIDITNQYGIELKHYINETLIIEKLLDSFIDDIESHNKKTGKSNNPNTWGNETYYAGKIDWLFSKFIDTEEKKILIINPDLHNVSKAGNQFNIEHVEDLTIAEKTRIISERLLKIAKEKSITETIDEQRKNKAKFLLVFEESHSLIPEFNSSANKGDQNASNGTAKVILQGRKYGLGSLVITQRTANISKSILNQCNTIFALRVFDDTGKQFLENYIGSDYSNILPTLEERHAIVVGKALKLKQPVIVKLNEADDIVIEHIEEKK